MKWFACVSKAWIALGLVAGASAAPQLTGSAVGNWAQTGANTAVVLAVAPSDASATLYDVRMKLVGEGAGRVQGEMRQRPQSGEVSSSVIDLVYRLEGRHRTLPDGRIELRAAILLDLRPFGATGVVEVGRMEGLLFPLVGELGYCPVLPAPQSAAELAQELGGLGEAASRRGAIGVLDPTLAPEPLPGEFIARWFLN
jgi:hypothetical protein